MSRSSEANTSYKTSCTDKERSWKRLEQVSVSVKEVVVVRDVALYSNLIGSVRI